MKVLELFAGSQSISNQFRVNSHECFTVDNFVMFKGKESSELVNKTSLNIDIMNLTSDMILEKFGQPDVIWASVPCTKFSVAAIGKHWIKGTNDPKTEGAAEAVKLVEHTLKIIDELNPSLYYIENPRGKLRKIDCMQKLPRYTITYCQYGDTRMKPTDIWTNHPEPNFRPMCHNGDPCHISAPRGSRTGTQGLANAVERSKIPEDFCKYIVEISEDIYNKDINDMNILELEYLKELKIKERNNCDADYDSEFVKQEIKELLYFIDKLKV